MKQYLAYWKPAIADRQRDRLGHSAGNQLGRVKRGDTVWIVTVRSGELFLLGRIVVGRVTDQATAEKLLKSNEVYEATHHIIAKSGTVESYRNIPISQLASHLRFESSTGRDRLDLVNGKVSAQQLQAMRVLKSESSDLLEQAFVSVEKASDTIGEDVDGQIPEEIDSGQLYRAGAAKSILVNAYERDKAARRACIMKWGTKCRVCQYDFALLFGKLGEGFIHVHHLRVLSEVDEEYELDPVNDLCPVCPNCHAMIHRRKPALTIEQVQQILVDHVVSKY